MALKWASAGALALAPGLAGCGLQAPPDVYPIAMADAYKLLAHDAMAAKVFGSNVAGSAGNGSDKITWWGEDPARIDCKIGLSAPAANQTKVSVDCGPAHLGEKHVFSMTLGQDRQAAIEMVDATLTGRPYDWNHKAQAAYRWPDNVFEPGPALADDSDSGDSSAEDANSWDTSSDDS